MSPIRFRLYPELHCYVHPDGRIEEWIVLSCERKPPLKLGEPIWKPWDVWEPE